MGCCCDAYETIREGNDIPVDDDCLSAVTDAADYDVSFFCDRHFVANKDATPFPSRNVSALISHCRSKLTTDRVIKYLTKNYGAYSDRKSLFGVGRLRCISGIEMKQPSRMMINVADKAEDMDT
jgi:hypothetical protein